MKPTFKKISFEKAKDSIERIFGSTSESWELVPDDIHRLALSAGLSLNWTEVKDWADFEYGTNYPSDNFFIETIFKEIKPNGLVYIVTDECFEDRQAYEVETIELDRFIAETYPEIYCMEFFQPADYIFICPSIQMIGMLHHEGLVTKYQKKN